MKYSLLLFLFVYNCVAQLNISRPSFVAGILKPATGGGGGSDDYYSETPENATAGVGNASTMLAFKTLVTTGGTGVSVDLWITNYFGNTEFHVAMYDTGGVRLAGQGTATSTGTGWLTVDIGDATLSSSTTYYITVQSDSGNVDLAYSTAGADADSTKFAANTYGDGLPANWPTMNDLARKYAARVHVNH